MLISIAIPCYRSEKNIARVVEEITQELSKRPENGYQIILVNDCSPDDTWNVIKGLAENDHHITSINLSRNYGQNNARLAAIPYIEGDVCVCMDDDGQHPADQIYTIVDKLMEGYDLVYAKFAHQKQTLMRRIASKLHTQVQEAIGAKPKGVVNCSFLGWSRFAIDTLKNYHSPFVSAGSFLLKSTTRITNVDVQQRERMSGHSGYTLKKMINLELTELTNFSNVPLRASGVLGAISAFAGVILGIILLIRKLISSDFIIGYASVIVFLLIIGGLILLSLGLMGEYIGKIYMTISNQPQYSVREIVNRKESGSSTESK